MRNIHLECSARMREVGRVYLATFICRCFFSFACLSANDELGCHTIASVPVHPGNDRFRRVAQHALARLKRPTPRCMTTSSEQINCVRCGDGSPALLIHGNPGTHSIWRPLIERLAGKRTFFTPDLPGFGGSPAPADAAEYGAERLAVAILAMADRLGLKRFDLVGHSFGGAVAITIAALAPERVRTLVAITPMSDQIPPRARLARMPLIVPFVSAMWHIAPGWVRRSVVRSWTHVSYDAGFIAARSEEVARESDRASLIRSVAGLIAQTDYPLYGRRIDHLQEIPAPPVLFIGAGRDRVIPHAHFVSLTQRVPRARVHTFAESGHVPVWQYPDEISALLLEFWESDRHAEVRRARRNVEPGGQ